MLATKKWIVHRIGLPLTLLTLASQTTLGAPPPPTPSPIANSTACIKNRGMWIWNTKELIGNPTEQDQLISRSSQAKVTEVYEYLIARDYTDLHSELATFNTKLNSAGIKVWGLEGYRGYFGDSYGSNDLYSAADALITFNATAPESARFVGFITDMEPQDDSGSGLYSSFHNGLTDSQLNRTTGGVWYATQSLDREMLMRDWLQIHKTLKEKMVGAGLLLAGSMVSWLDSYYGEEIAVTFNGVRQGVMLHMMSILNNYIMMTYNTNPASVAYKMNGALNYADNLPPALRPRVSAALETHSGAGSGISYGDTPDKNSRAAVLGDIQKIDILLGSHPSYCGTHIHDWVGWSKLNP